MTFFPVFYRLKTETPMGGILPRIVSLSFRNKCGIHMRYERASETSWNYGLGEIGKKKVVKNAQK